MATMTLSVSRPSQQVATSPIYRMDPSREMADLQDRLSQLTQYFADLLPQAGGRVSPGLMPIDVEETDDAYIVDLDLPNVREEDVQIELRGNELRIFGAYRDRERTGVLRRQSRRVGEFEFLVALPSDVDPEGVDASLETGVLRVLAPKMHSAQARRIEVHKGSQVKDVRKTPEQPGTAPAGMASPSMAQPSAGQAGSSQAGAAQRSS